LWQAQIKNTWKKYLNTFKYKCIWPHTWYAVYKPVVGLFVNCLQWLWLYITCYITVLVATFYDIRHVSAICSVIAHDSLGFSKIKSIKYFFLTYDIINNPFFLLYSSIISSTYTQVYAIKPKAISYQILQSQMLCLHTQMAANHSFHFWNKINFMRVTLLLVPFLIYFLTKPLPGFMTSCHKWVYDMTMLSKVYNFKNKFVTFIPEIQKSSF